MIVTPSVLDIPEHGTMHWCKGFEIPATKTVPTVYQSSKTVKNSQKTAKTAKMTIGVPIVRCLQVCTNSVPIVKNSGKQSKDSQNSKNEGLKLRD